MLKGQETRDGGRENTSRQWAVGRTFEGRLGGEWWEVRGIAVERGARHDYDCIYSTILNSVSSLVLGSRAVCLLAVGFLRKSFVEIIPVSETGKPYGRFSNNNSYALVL